MRRPKLLQTQILLTHENQGDFDRLQEIGSEELAGCTLYTESGVPLGRFRDLMGKVMGNEEVRQLEGEYPVPGSEEVWALPIELADAETYYVLDRSN